MTLDALIGFTLIAGVCGITALAIWSALFTQVVDPKQVPRHVFVLRQFGIGALYFLMVVAASCWVGLFAGVARRAFTNY